MPEDLGDEGMAERVDTVSRHIFTKQRQPQAILELSYIGLISHPRKIMIRLILNRLKAKAGELLADDQAGSKPGRSTTSSRSC